MRWEQKAIWLREISARTKNERFYEQIYFTKYEINILIYFILH